MCVHLVNPKTIIDKLTLCKFPSLRSMSLLELPSSLFFAFSSASKLRTSRSTNLGCDKLDLLEKSHPFALDWSLVQRNQEYNRQHISMKINGCKKLGRWYAYTKTTQPYHYKMLSLPISYEKKCLDIYYMLELQLETKGPQSRRIKSKLNFKKESCKGNLLQNTQKGRLWEVIQKRYQKRTQALSLQNGSKWDLWETKWP